MMCLSLFPGVLVCYPKHVFASSSRGWVLRRVLCGRFCTIMSELDEDEHMVEVHRGSSGFGFNIKGTVQEGGVMQAINGRLYPPLQYISHVDTSTSSSDQLN